MSRGAVTSIFWELHWHPLGQVWCPLWEPLARAIQVADPCATDADRLKAYLDSRFLFVAKQENSRLVQRCVCCAQQIGPSFLDDVSAARLQPLWQRAQAEHVREKLGEVLRSITSEDVLMWQDRRLGVK